MAVLVGRANKPRWAKEGEGSETARRLGREQRETAGSILLSMPAALELSSKRTSCDYYCEQF